MGIELPLHVVVTILECCVTFSGVKLSIRSFVLFLCASSACGVSLAHLNYTKHPMIRSVYRFHVCYHVRRILKKLQVPLPHKTGFNAADNPYTESEF